MKGIQQKKVKNPIKQCQYYQYEQALKSWVQYDTPKNEHNEKVAVQINASKEKTEEKAQRVSEELIVMSFNVWFSNDKFAERQKKLIEILEEINPHVFCFQEVIKEWVDRIVTIPYIQQNYSLSAVPSDLSTIGPYGVFIGVNKHKFDILDMKCCDLESSMARKLLCAKIRLKSSNDIFWINTVHLESIKQNTETRIVQLRTIFNKYMVEMKQMDNESTVMLMGDFNFRDCDKNLLSLSEYEFEENGYLNEDKFIDCWKQYAKDHKIKISEGWTRRIGYRYDRILMNIASKWNVKDFKILGDADNKMPSDHKGVVVYLK